MPMGMSGNVTSGNWNNCTTSQMFYYASGNASNWSNAPQSTGGFSGIVIKIHANRIFQFGLQEAHIYMRLYGGTSWSNWVAVI